MARKIDKATHDTPGYPTYAQFNPTRRRALALLGAGLGSVLLKACGGMQTQPQYFCDTVAFDGHQTSVLSTGERVTYDLYVEHESEQLNQLMWAEPETIQDELDIVFSTYSAQDLADPEVMRRLQDDIGQRLDRLHAARFGAGLGTACLSVLVDVRGVEGRAPGS